MCKKQIVSYDDKYYTSPHSEMDFFTSFLSNLLLIRKTFSNLLRKYKYFSNRHLIVCHKFRPKVSVSRVFNDYTLKKIYGHGSNLKNSTSNKLMLFQDERNFKTEITSLFKHTFNKRIRDNILFTLSGSKSLAKNVYQNFSKTSFPFYNTGDNGIVSTTNLKDTKQFAPTLPIFTKIFIQVLIS